MKALSTTTIITAVLFSLLQNPQAFAAPKAKPIFKQTNLVGSQSGGAAHQDTDLINPWGVAVGSDGYFWVSDNGSGKSTLYTASGFKSSLVVTIPNPTSSEASKPTGQVLNRVPSSFLSDSFIFDTEEGTIVGWNGGFTATVRSNQSSRGAIYKGLALARTTSGDFLYAADFHNAAIDVFDSSYNLVSSSNASRFVDPNTPAGYAPFNIHLVGKQFYVAYALQDSDKRDDVAADGNGFVSIFDIEGNFVKRFVTGSNAGGSATQLNSPWGIEVGPKSFGAYSASILVGNFGSGKIAAFNKRGKFLGFLSSKGNKTLQISGLWEIFAGVKGLLGDPNKLYFTAGPDDESSGLLGVLSPVSSSKGGKTSSVTPTPRPTNTPSTSATATPKVTATPQNTAKPSPTYYYPYPYPN